MFLRISAILVYLVASAGCTAIVRTGSRIEPPPTYLTAAREDLVEVVERIAAIRSMKSIIEITLTHISDDRRKEFVYRNVRGVMLTRRPEWIRTNAETPAGIAQLYDMASDGERFQVHVPWKNQLIVGPTALRHVSENRWENLRPQHVLKAIMLDPLADPAKTLLDTEKYGRFGYQVLHEIEEGEGGSLRIRRKFWFSRSDLALSRLMILDRQAEIATDAWYRDWQEENGIPYPKHILVERPADGYSVDIEIVRPGIDEDIPDADFELNYPDDVEVRTIGEEPE